MVMSRFVLKHTIRNVTAVACQGCSAAFSMLDLRVAGSLLFILVINCNK